MNKRVGTLLSAMLLTTCLGWQQPVANVQAAKQASGVTQPAKVGREIKLKGAENVRDLGGYVNRDGKTLKAHKVLRAAALDHLTKADGQKLVKTYHLKTILDLRTKEERRAHPDVAIKGVKNIANPVMLHAAKTDAAQLLQAPAGSAVKGMESYYRTIVLSKDGRKAYRVMFKQLLSNPKNQAVLFHCTAGKDRTGVGTALLLSALKFDRQTIMNDYLLSNRYRAKSNQQALAQLKASGASATAQANLKAVLGVQKSYLNASFSAINQKYGSMDNYLKKGLGLTQRDRQALKQAYLATPPVQLR